VIIGAIISIVDLVWPHTFSTILEVDYGTPFDRHVLIEDQKERRHFKFQIPRLEEPLGEVGSRILRRLSTRLSRRGGNGGENDVLKSPSGEASGSSTRRHLSPLAMSPDGRLGVDNHAYDKYEMNAPTSPWRYPNYDSNPFGSSHHHSGHPMAISVPARSSSPTLPHPPSLSSVTNKSLKSVSFRGEMKPELILRIPSTINKRRDSDDSSDDGNNVMNTPEELTHHHPDSWRPSFDPMMEMDYSWYVKLFCLNITFLK
jgi:hypothetical protein